MYWMLGLSYLVGSIPTAYLAGRALNKGDIRVRGDGNVGSQNAAHLFGLRVGIAVFIVDGLKGIVVIALARSIDSSLPFIFLSGMACVIGQAWSVFLGFKGGRGEATSIGVLTALITWPMVIAGALSLAALQVTKSVIKASVVLFVPLSPLCLAGGFSWQLIDFSVALPVLLGLIHLIKEKQQAALVVLASAQAIPDPDQPCKIEPSDD